MPEINVDDKNFELHKQCEIRRPSEKGYFFDIVWIKSELARKGNIIQDEDGNHWTVFEVHGSKKMPSWRGSFKLIP